MESLNKFDINYSKGWHFFVKVLSCPQLQRTAANYLYLPYSVFVFSNDVKAQYDTEDTKFMQGRHSLAWLEIWNRSRNCRIVCPCYRCPTYSYQKMSDHYCYQQYWLSQPLLYLPVSISDIWTCQLDTISRTFLDVSNAQNLAVKRITARTLQSVPSVVILITIVRIASQTLKKWMYLPPIACPFMVYFFLAHNVWYFIFNSYYIFIF